VELRDGLGRIEHVVHAEAETTRRDVHEEARNTRRDVHAEAEHTRRDLYAIGQVCYLHVSLSYGDVTDKTHRWLTLVCAA
jgi:hypothetical protein